MDILFLSHCVPYPPDKGEKIRAFYELSELAREYRVHLACLTRRRAEVEHAEKLLDRCASVRVEPLSSMALPKAAAQFALGGCLNLDYYHSRRLDDYVRDLAGRVSLAASVSYTVVMAQYAPPGIPNVLDMIDVDSEKWFEYARNRRPRLAFALEAERLRKQEVRYARSAACTLLTTREEEKLFRSFSGEVASTYMENGVDFDAFDPASCASSGELAGRQFVVFTGTMDYWPNIDAACWFAQAVLPEVRRRNPRLEFFVVGRNPSKAVQALTRLPGVTVTGAVPDIRVYLKHALAFVAPLRLARGIQNKVLEALAMGKTVLAAPAVCRTFGGTLPEGILECPSEQAFADRICGPLEPERPEIRRLAFERFRWPANMKVLLSELRNGIDAAAAVPRRTVPGAGA